MSRFCRRGSNVVEFAIILPLLVALLTSVVDYGWVMLHQHLGADAALTGARAAASAESDEDPLAIAIDGAATRWAAFGIPTTPDITSTTSADTVEVHLAFGDVRLLGLVPGPDTMVITRSKLLEETL